MDSFDRTVEDWTIYVERAEQYCLANEISEERKVAVLLRVMRHTTCFAASLHSPNLQIKLLQRSQKS